jgi:uncharacterized phage protein gp47/JayE
MNIVKDIKTIRQELFEYIESVQEEYTAKGWLPAKMNLNNGVIRGLLEIFIWGIWQLYQFLAFVLTQATPNKATGEWLNVHAEAVEVPRKEATKAAGGVVFTRKAGRIGNIRIPSGKIVRTPVDAEGRSYRYVTTAEAVMQTMEDTVSISVVSEEYGAKANATAGLIREMVTPIDGIGAVTNSADWLTSEGADVEGDTSLFERYRLQWQAQAGVTSAAYAFAALSVPGVAAVKIVDNHPRGQGTVDVIILGTGGAPTEQLLAAVRLAIADTIIIDDDVLVKPVELTPVDMACTVEYLSGNEPEIKAVAERYIRERALVMSRTIGADIIIARLISDVINMPGVKRVVWESPAEDVVMPGDHIMQLSSLTVNTRAVADE